MSSETPSSDLLSLASQIVSAHVARNPVATEELPALIREVYRALVEVSSGTVPAAEPERPQPAVPIKRSITPDYLICLEDGKKLKMLKRHLKTAYDLTPDQYRERWGLPPDYPMVAPNYARQRSELAREIGLGSRTRR